jgi:hypothetical protein
MSIDRVASRERELLAAARAGDKTKAERIEQSMRKAVPKEKKRARQG